MGKSEDKKEGIQREGREGSLVLKNWIPLVKKNEMLRNNKKIKTSSIEELLVAGSTTSSASGGWSSTVTGVGRGWNRVSC